MDFEADAVAEPVVEVLAVAILIDDIAGDLIHIAATHPGLHGGNHGAVGFQDDVVDLLEAFGRGAEEDGAGHIRAVAIDQHAHIDEQLALGLKHGVIGLVVALNGVDAGAENGVEGFAQAALGFDNAELAEHLQLAHPRLEDLHQLSEERVIGLGRAADGIEFAGGLDRAQGADHCGDRGPLGVGHRLLQGLELGHGEVALIADGLPALGELGVVGQLFLGGLELANIHADEDAVGHLQVAEVGVERRRALLLNEEQAIAGGQSREVVAVDGRVEKDGIHAGGLHRRLQTSNAFEMFLSHNLLLELGAPGPVPSQRWSARRYGPGPGADGGIRRRGCSPSSARASRARGDRGRSRRYPRACHRGASSACRHRRPRRCTRPC